MFNFEKLEAWHKAIAFADSVYRVTQSFPAVERFGLTSQLRRAAVSIPSNLAEGSARSSRSDFARFVEIATGSLFEVVSQLAVARSQGFLDEVNHRKLYLSAEELIRMFSGLRKSLHKSPA